MSIKRDRAMEELRALVLANNPHITSAELEKLTDLQVLERLRNSFIVDDPGRPSNDWEVVQMRARLDNLIKKYRAKPHLH